MPKSRREQLLACAAAVEVVRDGQLLKKIRVLPFGKFTLRDGRGTFSLPKENAEAVLAATKEWAGAQSLMVDYDHQSLYAVGEDKGGKAPASGWLENLSIGEDGIYSEPEWTPRAAKEIVDKEYRYISPLFGYDAETRVVTRLFNAGLTNTPAIDDLTKLAASFINKKENQMDLTALAASLGLGADATLEQIMAASKAQTEKLAAASAELTGIKQSLGVKDDAKAEEVIAAASKLNVAKDGEVVVAASFIANMQNRLNALEAGNTEKLVAAAIESGKITPAQKQDALEWAKTNPSGFEKFIAAAASFEGGKTTQATDTNAKTLSKEEIAAASLAGVTAEEYLAEKARLEKEGEE